MTRRPGEKPVDTPGGKAAERLREFEAARGLTEASKESDDAAQEGFPAQNAGEAPKDLISSRKIARQEGQKRSQRSNQLTKKSGQRSSAPGQEGKVLVFAVQRRNSSMRGPRDSLIESRSETTRRGVSTEGGKVLQRLLLFEQERGFPERPIGETPSRDATATRDAGERRGSGSNSPTKRSQRRTPKRRGPASRQPMEATARALVEKGQRRE